MTIQEVKEKINELIWEGEQMHEGPMIDLGKVLLRIIHNFEHKGIDWVLEKYWKK